ncbi:MAG: hypothetical protein R3B72_43925 [Polyangiaceae bacterium]
MSDVGWTLVGIAVWGIFAILLVRGVARDRRRASESLASLGLEVLRTSVVDPRQMREPRAVARGRYRGLDVVVEDFVALLEDGSESLHTRLRVDREVELPVLVARSGSFPSARELPEHLHRHRAPALEGWGVAHVADARGESLLKSILATDSWRALLAVEGAGALDELRAVDGELSLLLAGMAIDASKVGPGLDALVVVVEAAARLAERIR